MNEITGESKINNRVLATCVDYGATFCLNTLYIVQVGDQNADGVYQVSGLLALLPVVFWLLYFPAIESMFDATLGHWIFNLKVIKSNGQPINFTSSFKRHLLDPVDIFMFGIPAFISINKTTKHQRLGDIWADTVVIKVHGQ